MIKGYRGWLRGLALFLVFIVIEGCGLQGGKGIWVPPKHWYYTDKTRSLDELVRTPDKSSMGEVTSLLVDRVHPGTLFAGTNGGLFKSTNGGREWFPINEGLPGYEVLSLAQDPDRPDLLYAGIRKSVAGIGGVFRSEDGGAYWKPLPQGPQGYSIYTLLAESGRLYAGSYGGGLFFSRDEGKTWHQQNEGLDSVAVLTIARDPFEFDVLYVGTERGLYRCRVECNPGSKFTWDSLGLGVGSDAVMALAMDPGVPGRIYVGMERHGLLLSENGGETWRRVQGLEPGAVRSLLTRVPSSVYAAVGSSVYQTGDGGLHWRKIQSDIPGSSVLTLAMDPRNPGRLYTGRDLGRGIHVARISDGGMDSDERSEGLALPGRAGGLGTSERSIRAPDQQWLALNRGLVNTSVMALLVSVHDSSVIYAATWGEGLIVSRDAGAHWEASHEGFGSDEAFSITEHPHDSKILYAGGGRGIYKSVDGGGRWERVESSIRKPIHIAIDPQNPQTVYVASWGDGFFKSVDGGKHWIDKSRGLEVKRAYSVVIDPTRPQTLYLGTDFDLYKSTDGGDHWEALRVRPVQTVVLDPSNPSTIYAGTCKWIYKSTDGGAHWVIKRKGMEYTDVYSMAVDPTNPNVIYAGTYDGGMYKSVDAGESWFRISKGLPNPNVYSLAIDTAHPQVLYAGTFAGTFGSGVYRTTDGGNRWETTHPGGSLFTQSDSGARAEKAEMNPPMLPRPALRTGKASSSLGDREKGL